MRTRRQWPLVDGTAQHEANIPFRVMNIARCFHFLLYPSRDLYLSIFELRFIDSYALLRELRYMVQRHCIVRQVILIDVVSFDLNDTRASSSHRLLDAGTGSGSEDNFNFLQCDLGLD